jgi:hypothetical protein
MVLSQDIKQRLIEFIIDEERSCSMDMGCVSPEYVHRMWGGAVAIDEIENALNYLKTNNYGY